MGGELRIAIGIASAVLSDWRAVVRLAESREFRDYYESATNKEELEGWIKQGNLTVLKAWMIAQRQDCLENMSIRALRKLASKYQIPRYCRLSKLALLRQIKLVQGHSVVF